MSLKTEALVAGTAPVDWRFMIGDPIFRGIALILLSPELIMATTKAREDIKADLKTLKADLTVGAREETQRLRDKAEAAEARLREKAGEAEALLREKGEEVRERAKVYYDQARNRSREYYDDASERIDEAQRYITERVQERPVQSTAIALGVGVVLGLLLAGRRR